MPRLERTVRDAVYGVAVGDALGVPVEGKSRGAFHVDTMVGGGTHDKPAGTYSDDTSLTLATANSIRICEGIDVEDMLKRYQAWLFNGAYVVDGSVFGVGRTTCEALKSGRGLDGVQNNGNGSLMRIVPLAFVNSVTDEQIEAVSAITHAHEIARRACVIYVRLAQALLDGVSIAGALRRIDAEAPFDRLKGIAGLSEDDIRSSGYVVDTLEAALWCLATTADFESAVRAGVNLGNDADTTGAVTGGLAGIVYGKEAIPSKWVSALRGRGILEACLF